jgi:peptide/nickel transport system permease protein
MLVSMAMLCILVFIAIATPYYHHMILMVSILRTRTYLLHRTILLGTDYLGRDMLSRIMHGATTSLSISAGVVCLSLIIGISLGCIAGYYGGLVDEIISRAIDVFLAFRVSSLPWP